MQNGNGRAVRNVVEQAMRSQALRLSENKASMAPHQLPLRRPLPLRVDLAASVVPVPPHRPQPLATGEQRLAMVRRACAGHKQLVADDWELRHPSGPSYTLATLKHYKRLIGARPLVFVVGADSFAGLHRWHRWREFPALCHLAVVPRPHSPPAPLSVQRAFPAAPASLLCVTCKAYTHKVMYCRLHMLDASNLISLNSD